MKFAFFDINTQKAFIESFGSRAVPFAGEIRENLMHLTSIAVRDGIPLFATMFNGDGCEKGSDLYDKVMDSTVEGGIEFDGSVGAAKQLLLSYRNEDELKRVCIEAVRACSEDLEVVFVYGVRASVEVYKVCEALVAVERDVKVWVVNDCIKDDSSEVEMETLKKLKEALGVRSITTRNLDKFVKI